MRSSGSKARRRFNWLSVRKNFQAGMCRLRSRDMRPARGVLRPLPQGLLRLVLVPAHEGAAQTSRSDPRREDSEALCLIHHARCISILMGMPFFLRRGIFARLMGLVGEGRRLLLAGQLRQLVDGCLVVVDPGEHHVRGSFGTQAITELAGALLLAGLRPP